MKHIFGLVLGIMLLSITMIPNVALAQDGQAIQEEQPQTGTGATVEDDTGFDWRWLLPLVIAIPIIYLLARRKDTRDRDRNPEHYVGTKGGRTNKFEDDN